MSVLDMITRNLVDINYEALPADVVKETKKQILDMLGVMIVGSTCSISGELNGLVDLVKEWGGKEESTIIAFGGRVPAPNAAFVNGTLCVRRDFDDTQVTDLVFMHPSRSIVPTAFAMAERQGDINGKEFISAAALGHDLECRILAAVGRRASGSIYQSTSFFGATATAGKILGLNEEKLRYALGLAYHQVCGASGGGGGAGVDSIKGISNGFACKAGIVSTLLAERGFTIEWDFLEAKNRKNFYEMFFDGAYWPKILTAELGKVFMGLDTAQKDYPCCHGMPVALSATLSLIREHNIKPDDVVDVLVHLKPSDYHGMCEPIEKKQDPQNVIETQFSIPWGVASVIVYGEAGIKNFTEEALRDTSIRETARKVFAKPEMELHQAPFSPAIVDIRCKDGMVYSNQVDYPFGSPENPMSFADVVVKFRDCCQYSVKPIPKDNQDRVIQMVEGLEKVSDASQIVRLLA